MAGRSPSAGLIEGGVGTATAQEGYCGTTTEGGDCTVGHAGSWVLSPAESRSWSSARTSCVDRCMSCRSCRYVSFSLNFSDCSWFRACDSLKHGIAGFRTVGPLRTSTPRCPQCAKHSLLPRANLSHKGCVSAVWYERHVSQRRAPGEIVAASDAAVAVSLLTWQQPRYVSLLLRHTLAMLGPHSRVVLHLNANTRLPQGDGTRGDSGRPLGGELTWMRDEPRVLLNPRRVPVKRLSCSILLAHLLNVKHLLEVQSVAARPPGFVLLMASNMVFMRPGVEAAIACHRSSTRGMSASPWCLRDVDCEYDSSGATQKRSTHCRLTQLRASPFFGAIGSSSSSLVARDAHEGQFHPLFLFQRLIAALEAIRPLGELRLYGPATCEETIPASFFATQQPWMLSRVAADAGGCLPIQNGLAHVPGVSSGRSVIKFGSGLRSMDQVTSWLASGFDPLARKVAVGLSPDHFAFKKPCMGLHDDEAAMLMLVRLVNISQAASQP